MKRVGTLSLFLVLLAIPAFADEFSAVVKNFESHHGIRRANPHLIGLASLIANPMVWGSDAARFQIASFENGDAASKLAMQELDRIFLASVNSNWHQVLQIGSPKKGQATSIYTSFTGNNVRLLIGSIEGNAIGVVQMELDEKAIARVMAGLRSGSQALVRAKQKQ
ncbi:MAG TPA: hypothetical protein VMG30_18965 [Acidobacteriota bacterium]|nr:hypothetical protein [Acidobacteriota bacterium]